MGSSIVRLTTPRFSGRGSPPAIGVLSAGYRPLGSCPRAAGWSAATLCNGPDLPIAAPEQFVGNQGQSGLSGDSPNPSKGFPSTILSTKGGHHGDVGRANESPAGTGALRTEIHDWRKRGRSPRDC